MKLNKDNYELIMFDLLEGNLPENEGFSVMKQIEEDEFLFREWNLLKSTVLTPDLDLIFTGKDKLVKKETRIIPFYRIGAIAASIALLIAAVFYFSKLAEQGGGELVDEIESVAPTKTEPLMEVLPAPNEKSAIPVFVNKEKRDSKSDKVNGSLENLIEDDSPTEMENYKASFVDEQENTPALIVNNTPDNKKEEHIEEVQTPENFENVPEESIPIITATNSNTLESKPVELNNSRVITFDQIRDYKLISQENVAKLKTFVTSKPQMRIKKRVYETVAMLRNPKIRFKPQFNAEKPYLDIEFETSGYEAIASIQPFKNNRN